jgi:DNA-directed RNA polymerase, mitochondrial
LEDVASILTDISAKDIDITHVVSSRVFTSSEEAADLIKMLSTEAVKLDMRGVVSALGQAETKGSTLYDPLDDVPQVKPVEKMKVTVVFSLSLCTPHHCK